MTNIIKYVRFYNSLLLSNLIVYFGFSYELYNTNYHLFSSNMRPNKLLSQSLLAIYPGHVTPKGLLKPSDLTILMEVLPFAIKNVKKHVNS